MGTTKQWGAVGMQASRDTRGENMIFGDYDSWKTTPPDDPPEDRWGYDPDAEADAGYFEDEEDQ